MLTKTYNKEVYKASKPLPFINYALVMKLQDFLGNLSGNKLMSSVTVH